MDIENIGIKSNDNKNDLPQTSVDNALNKENLFALDTEILAIKKCLQEMFNELSPFTEWYDGTEDNNHRAGLHNSVYRGKRLGTQVTEEQLDSIDRGIFYNLWIGDYWQINDNKWRIAAFDYFYNMGTIRHHAVIVPDNIITTAKMNDTATAAGGYAGTDFRTGNNGNTARQTAITAISNAFGASNILTHQECFSNSVNSSGMENDCAEYDATVELLNEHMLFGGKMFEQTSQGTVRPTGINTIANSQLPLFLYAHSFIKSTGYYWLRTIATAPYFSIVTTDGISQTYGASNVFGIRPYFCLGKGA